MTGYIAGFIHGRCIAQSDRAILRRNWRVLAPSPHRITHASRPAASLMRLTRRADSDGQMIASWVVDPTTAVCRFLFLVSADRAGR